MFKIYDWDKESGNLNDQDFLGMLDCTLAEIVSTHGKKVQYNFVHKKYFVLEEMTLLQLK